MSPFHNFMWSQVVALLLLGKKYSFAATFSPDATPVPLPGQYDITEEIDIGNSTAPESQSFLPVLLPITSAGEMCALNHFSQESYIPVGRSYDGHDWENVAGIHMRIKYLCDSTHCQVELPREFTYYITCYQHTLHNEDKIARFLEKATFGPTRSLIDNWDFSPSSIERSFARFIDDEIKKDVTSHREYFRQRLNPKSLENYKYGRTGPRACEKNSRWRKYTFTEKDAFLSRGKEMRDTGTAEFRPNPRYQLTFEEKTVSGETAYVLSFAGQIRTVVYDKPTDDKTGEDIDISKAYYICHADEMQGSMTTFLNHRFQISLDFYNETTCISVKGGNPSVNIDSQFVDTTLLHTIDFSQLSIGTSGTDIIEINQNKTNGGDLLLQNEFTDAVCSSLPDPYDNDYRDNFLSYIAEHYPMWSNPSRFAIDPPTFARLNNNEWAIHDYRLLFHENTIENPLMDGGGQDVLDTVFTKGDLLVESYGDTMFWRGGIIRGDESATLCANAAPTIFNQDHCKLSYEPNTCQSGSMQGDTDMFVTIDATFMQQIRYGKPGLAPYIVVAIDGLEFDSNSLPHVELPCHENAKSRWIPVSIAASECEASNTVKQETVDTFVNLLLNTIDNNPLMKDVYYYKRETAGIMCDSSDESKYGFRVKVIENGQEICYENVHPDKLSLYDITIYQSNHPFGAYMRAFSRTGVLTYPPVHQMTSADWYDCERYTCPILVGRMGDTMSANDAADAFVYNPRVHKFVARKNADLFLDYIAKNLAFIQLKGYGSKVKHGGVVVCGSPGEVGQDVTVDDSFDIQNGRLDSVDLAWNQKVTVWTSIALWANDQLRQRMAWALCQMLNISPTTFEFGNEGNLYLYDIYVRNAFGNYRDILREMSFNPKVGEMLTFIDNKAIRFEYDIYEKILYPDENYARELMQLYTIGLHELEMDGTPKLNRYGDLIQTYNTKNILSFARAWTGFHLAQRRGNYEELDHSAHSYMDPMVLNPGKHDFFPKMNIDGGYIGDRMPLCWDLPERAFLRKGAKFVLLGGSPLPKFHTDPSATLDPSLKRFVLNPNSQLYTKLCSPSGSGECQFQGSVTLDENINCFGIECTVVTVVVLQVKPGVFYEYLQRPCVQLAFYEGAKKVVDERNSAHMCAHPKMPVAMTACCGNPPLDTTHGSASCVYSGEQVTYQVNSDRCGLLGGQACDIAGMNLTKCNSCCSGYYNEAWPEQSGWYWTTESCKQQLKVRIDGSALIVHKPAVTNYVNGKPEVGFPNTVRYVSEDRNMNYITVHWPRDQYTGDEMFPHVDNDCWWGDCQEMSDGTCLCDISVEDEAVFSAMPTREDVLTDLLIGSFEVDLYDAGHYRSVGASGGVDVFAPVTAQGDYSSETVFGVIDKFGGTKYFKNMKSSIKMGSRGRFEMRNLPHFIDFAQFELNDVHHEIEAVIDNVFYNENTPPFVAKQLIQRFGISNPSPRYVRTVATAFFEGSYQWTDGSTSYSYGNNKYGDLAATAAAILLDREATSVSLDADPIHGSLREPLLKTIAFMRAMEYTPTNHDRNKYPKFLDLATKIGQQPYMPPDQFSFFSPEFMPVGGFMQAALTSPESEILTMSQTVGITSGFFSLVRNGLYNLYGGLGHNSFGANPSFKGQHAIERVIAGDYDKSVGYLSKSPTDTSVIEMVDELASLLTSGRLSPENRAILVTAYNDALVRYSNSTEVQKHDFAWRTVQQLISTTPEFHSTNLAKMTANEREVTPPQEPLDDSYKAIVVLFLFGGLDSYNLLTPYTTCGDLYESYTKQRGAVKLFPAQMLPIDASTSKDQPCDTFGIHHKAPTFKSLYDDGEGLFIANTGHLDKIVTKDNWRQETSTDLFSHTSLEREAYSVDAFKDQYGTGILGRLLDVFQDDGYAVGSNAINEGSYILGGDPLLGRTVDVIPGTGLPKFERQKLETGELHHLPYGIDEIKPIIFDLNSESSPQNGFFADHWSQNLIDTWAKTENLADIFHNNPTELDQHSWPDGLGQYFKLISQMIKGHKDRKKNRDVIFLRLGGFDAHAEVAKNLQWNLGQIDSAFAAFREELKLQGNYGNVTVLMASEFGRTITPNSGGGTDHAWGGNYFMFGGGVKGGQIVGKYPKSFWESDETNIGRGRIIPTMPWEATWFGISQWFGISTEEDMTYVLPNHGNFGCFLFTDKDLYNDGTNEISGCDGTTIDFEITAFMNEPRYLTGAEQKKICASATSIALEKTGKVARCLIIGQKIIVSYARRLSDGTTEETSMTLKQYLDAGGSRRLFGEPSFSVAASPLLTYASQKIDPHTGELVPMTAVEMTQRLRNNLEPQMMNFIQNMTGLAGVTAATYAPTVSPNPTQNPTVSPRPTPKFHPSAVPTISTAPTSVVSRSPSRSQIPSMSPSKAHSDSPSLSPITPTQNPSVSPGPTPKYFPSAIPTKSPAPTETSSLVPSTSAFPSMVPTSAPTMHLSLLPSASLLPTQAPTYTETFIFDTQLSFKNVANINLSDSEKDIYIRALMDQFREYRNIARDDFISVASQEIVVPNSELLVRVKFMIGSTSSVSGQEFENLVIKRLRIPIVESKIVQFMKSRGVAVTNFEMLSVMSVAPSLAPSISLAPTVAPSVIITPTTGTETCAGYMFNIIAKDYPIHVTSFDVIAVQRSRIEFRVYTRPKQYLGAIYNARAWSLIHKVQVRTAGPGKLVSLGRLNKSIDIDPESSQAFYITTSHKLMFGDRGTERYHNDIIENAHLQIYQGIGLAKMFGRQRTYDRWIGGVTYTAPGSPITARPPRFIDASSPSDVDAIVTGLNNVAKGKPASQSTVSNGGVPSRAVDGNRNGDWTKNSVTHTTVSEDCDTWWKVDLQDSYKIEYVAIFNRVDCCSERLHDFHVETLRDNGSVIDSIIFENRAKYVTMVQFYPSEEVHSVRIRKPNCDSLSLAEVEVYTYQ